MRVALIHDWLVGMRGGEKCLEVFCELFPDADIYTLVYQPENISPLIRQMRVSQSWISDLPFARKNFRNYLPLFPRAIESFELTDYDLILSSSHCVAKGARVGPRALHLCYCHTPMRYIWGAYQEYFGPGRAALPARLAMKATVGWLRRWDVRTAANPHFFIANSENVRRRIWDLYRREADVIYPPVDVASLRLSTRDDGFFLMVTALVPYKRLELVLDPGSFQELDADLSPQDPLGFVDSKKYRDRLRSTYKGSGLREAFLSGVGTVDGRPVSLGSFAFEFMGGSMGSVVGEKVARVLDRAYERRIPAIVFSSTGGARMQEGIFSLMQMAKTSAALNRFRTVRKPYVSVMLHPTTGGVAASFAWLGDVIIAEPKALIGFAGPRVIEQTIREKLPEGFQRSEFLLEHGMIDTIVKRPEMRQKLAQLLTLLA